MWQERQRAYKEGYLKYYEDTTSSFLLAHRVLQQHADRVLDVDCLEFVATERKGMVRKQLDDDGAAAVCTASFDLANARTGCE